MIIQWFVHGLCGGEQPYVQCVYLYLYSSTIKNLVLVLVLVNFVQYSPPKLAVCAPKYSIDQSNTLSNSKSVYFNAKKQLVEFVAIKSVLKGVF